jgi:alkylation response protein AidB-like acyl-CoA dehydrogenase
VKKDQKQMIEEAEELLGHNKSLGFAKSLYVGKVESRLVFPFPSLNPEQELSLQNYLSRVRDFLHKDVDPVTIDREAKIPDHVVKGLFDLGVMSMSIPTEYGGLNFSQYAYCKVMEEVAAVDASLAILINAHQSIGIKSLILFGSERQKEKWLPKLVRGEILAAFALTEPNAGSDAGGIETHAILNKEGTHYLLSGKKQWITNGGVAGLLTVMAKIPNTQDRKGREKITAFLVTPDMTGFQVEAVALDKCGIRGTITSKLNFDQVPVPVENVIGPEGKGLRLALTLLDFGRTTFGASCTGVAKRCLADAVQHAKDRRQFGKSLGEFELVKKKIAEMAALCFAMESGTYLTAHLIDQGAEDYMIETAMLKVFASESLWTIVNETIQIFGGYAYFTDLPYERMLRDARINMIGEGANDVLRTFIALVGMRDVGLDFQSALDFLKSPIRNSGNLFRFAKKHFFFSNIFIPITCTELQSASDSFSNLVRCFGRCVRNQLIKHREKILEKQYIQKRIADAATEIYMTVAVLSRLENLLKDSQEKTGDIGKKLSSGLYYCRTAELRVRQNLKELNYSLDTQTTDVANKLLH